MPRTSRNSATRAQPGQVSLGGSNCGSARSVYPGTYRATSAVMASTDSVMASVSAVTPVPYAEIVASIASRSAGPGTRANIDEFTVTTARAIESIGGAERGKAVIILNPVDPPMIMRDTVFCAISPEADQDAVVDSVLAMVAEVARYVPGYTLRADPQFDPPAPEWGGQARVAVFLEVRGNGDYLPPWAGNLDIMTAAAARVGDLLAASRTGVTA